MGDSETYPLVVINTRIPGNVKRAMEIVVAGGELTLQTIMDKALTDWLRTFHPDALACIGNAEWEAEVAGRYIAQRPRPIR